MIKLDLFLSSTDSYKQGVSRKLGYHLMDMLTLLTSLINNLIYSYRYHYYLENFLSILRFVFYVLVISFSSSSFFLSFSFVINYIYAWILLQIESSFFFDRLTINVLKSLNSKFLYSFISVFTSFFPSQCHYVQSVSYQQI